MAAVNELYAKRTEAPGKNSEQYRLKAILSFVEIIDDKPKEQQRIFNTDKAKEICKIKNSFDYAIETIYLSGNGMLFIQDNKTQKLRLPFSQGDLRKWIGENEPDKYIKFFWEVEEG